MSALAVFVKRIFARNLYRTLVGFRSRIGKKHLVISCALAKALGKQSVGLRIKQIADVIELA